VNKNIPHNHSYVFQQFISAIHHGDSELDAHDPDGINGVTLANAIMLSFFTIQGVTLPLDAEAYGSKLKELIQNSAPSINCASFHNKQRDNGKDGSAISLFLCRF